MVDVRWKSVSGHGNKESERSESAKRLRCVLHVRKQIHLVLSDRSFLPKMCHKAMCAEAARALAIRVSACNHAAGLDFDVLAVVAVPAQRDCPREHKFTKQPGEQRTRL